MKKSSWWHGGEKVEILSLRLLNCGSNLAQTVAAINTQREKHSNYRWDRVGCLLHGKHCGFARLIVREECQSLARRTLLVTTHQPPLWTWSTTGEIALWETSQTDGKRASRGEGTINRRRGDTLHSVCVQIWRRASMEEDKSFSFHVDAHLPFVVLKKKGLGCFY